MARRAAGAAAAPGDGRGQRHPRLLLRRRALRRPPTPRSRTASSCASEGADLLDIGGESTRPGATRPLVAEELDRVVPVIRALAAEASPVSVDTMRHEVARAALEAGAVLVNDVSGGLADPRVLDVVAEHGAAYVVMHWRAHSEVMQQLASYDDVLVEVRDELAQRLDAADGGRYRRRTGWSSTRASASPRPPTTTGSCCGGCRSWRRSVCRSWSAPAASPSSARSLAGPDGSPRPVLDREDANVALTTIAAIQGVWAVRVHEVRASMDAIKVVTRWRGGRAEAVSRRRAQVSGGSRGGLDRPFRRCMPAGSVGPP